MKKINLNAILIGLLVTLAMACGAAGDDPGVGDPGLGEQLGEEEVVDEDGQDIDEEVDEDVDEEDEGPGLDGPFCGDGFVDDGEECDDGNGEDGDGCSGVCEIEIFAAEADIAIDLIVDDLNSNEAPLETGCIGTIALEVNGGALAGEGRCFLPANFLDYTMNASLDEDGTVEGDITIVLNNRPNVLPISGTLENSVLSLQFDGVTLLVGSIRGVWDGTITADFD